MAPLGADGKISGSQNNGEASAEPTLLVSLDGDWLFRTDPSDSGTKQSWYNADTARDDWRTVSVPHTWQIEPALTEYRGVAWYRRTFDVSDSWRGKAVRVEFEAVFHSARIWVNGALAGEHIGKPYTTFELDITKLLRFEGQNTIAVRVDNSFNEHMLPRGRSSDWAHDGGIYRPVRLLISPEVFIERVDVEAVPGDATGEARLHISAFLSNTGTQSWKGTVGWRVVDDATGLIVATKPKSAEASLSGAGSGTAAVTGSFPNAKLWHFDHPNLYRLEVEIQAGRTPAHSFCTTFGVRRFEVKNAAFYLNGERVRLMGVERMAGSNPEFGMAEPTAWITHDHDDLKNLNCVFTRVHWQQDRRVLDYCDRHGIMIQTEVPTWGADTFKGMGEQPDPDIMKNGLEQLREMIARDRNHPSIVSWGLCNEINGQNPPAYNFAKNMLKEAKRLDPNRLCSYASHSLRQTPGKDVSGLMDFIACNEYFGSWYPGDADAVGRNVDEIHAAFPDKPIVISEYGYCACTAERPEGDERRREIMRTHDEVLRTRDFIGGLIFFCYNDYRTHIGDRGTGVMRQRVHGVVDLYGSRKGSYE
ncbi:MAG: beta galactosidase jelly roll domain-containing protein, partial [Acidobacteriota bacterium]|nr:beta galactosidase jelly roll domain-containing protein [Acidobacteriota bacterium]